MGISPNIVTNNPGAIPTDSAFLDIPEGFVALALPAGELAAVAGYIHPGDYIDIMATVNTQMFVLTKPRQVTKTVFADVYILRVGPSSTVSTQGQAQGVTSSITVVMTQCDAGYMTWLLSNAAVRYTLKSFKDYGGAASSKPVGCSSTDQLTSIGPAAVNARWEFTSGA
jgi:Flp pilus assembly protein CpaB